MDNVSQSFTSAVAAAVTQAGTRSAPTNTSNPHAPSCTQTNTSNNVRGLPRTSYKITASQGFRPRVTQTATSQAVVQLEVINRVTKKWVRKRKK